MGLCLSVLQVVDLGIVCVSLVTDVLLGEALVVLRLWRVVRIAHGVYEAMEDKLHEKEHQIQGLTAEVAQLKQQLEQLTSGGPAAQAGRRRAAGSRK